MTDKLADWHEAIPLAQAVYARHCAGCCAHVILDDGNVEQEFAALSLERARGLGHADCLALCEFLVRMSPTQRLKLSRQIRYEPISRA